MGSMRWLSNHFGRAATVLMVCASVMIASSSDVHASPISADTLPAQDVTNSGAVLHGNFVHSYSDGSQICAYAIGASETLGNAEYQYVGNWDREQTLYVRGQGCPSGASSFDMRTWTPSGQGLKPSTKYYYRVGVGYPGSASTCPWSESCYLWSATTESFTTLADVVEANIDTDDPAMDRSLTGDTITFTAGGSTSEAGMGLSYRWDLDDDGVFETDSGSTSSASTSFSEAGTHTVHVQVVSDDPNASP